MPRKSRPPIDSIAEAQRNWQTHYTEESSHAMASVVSVMRVAQLLRQATESCLAPYGITFPQYEVLALLKFAKSDALPMSKVSARLNVPAASVTHTVNRLEAQHLVRRTPDPADGRGTLLSVTDQGLTLIHAATPALNALFGNLGIDQSAHQELRQLCDALRAAHGDTVA